MPSKVADDVVERLAAVREASGRLLRSRVKLIRRMHESLRDLRSVRDRLLEGRANGTANRMPTAAERLAEEFHLTPRELEVAVLLSGGAPNATIAARLGISEHTARHHTRHVLVKLGVHSRARAGALIARELGPAAANPEGGI